MVNNSTVKPAKRKSRTQSVTADVGACSCDHHGHTDEPNLPWLPKRVRFNGTVTDFAGQADAKKIPSLLPLNLPTTSRGPTATVTSQTATLGLTSNGGENLNAETLRAQIRLNTQLMSTIESLRNNNDKVAKERDFYKMKLSAANERMLYLKKKVNKNAGNDENINPNVGAVDPIDITKHQDDNSQ